MLTQHTQEVCKCDEAPFPIFQVGPEDEATIQACREPL